MRIYTHLHVILQSFYRRKPTDPQLLLADLSECGLDGGWIMSVDSMITTTSASSEEPTTD